MVAILVPQPDETTGDPALDLPAQARRRATWSHPRPVDLVGVEPLGGQSLRRALPDRPTRIRRRRLVALLIAVATGRRAGPTPHCRADVRGEAR
jgi:hypothetical protein